MNVLCECVLGVRAGCVVDAGWLTRDVFTYMVTSGTNWIGERTRTAKLRSVCEIIGSICARFRRRRLFGPAA